MKDALKPIEALVGSLSRRGCPVNYDPLHAHCEEAQGGCKGGCSDRTLLLAPVTSH
jgi:hypothetical protein